MNLPAQSSCFLIRTRALLIGVVVLVAYVYFYQGGGWNQNSRFDLVRAMVELGTLRIDAYRENTGDKAFANGHYYSDKAPGLALLAEPIAEATRPLLRAGEVDPDSARGLVAMSYVVTVFGVALPMAVACAVLFLIALQLGSDTSAAAFGALALGLATPMWAYFHAVLGTFACGGVLGVRVCICPEAMPQSKSHRGCTAGAGRRPDSGVGNGYGIPCGASGGDRCCSCCGVGLEGWVAATMAYVRGHCNWRVRLHCRAFDLSVSCLWLRVSAQLLVLPGWSISVDEAWLHGSDLSQD